MQHNTKLENVNREVQGENDIERMTRAGESLSQQATDGTSDLAATAIDGAHTLLDQSAQITHDIMMQGFRNMRVLSQPMAAFGLGATELTREWLDFGQRMAELNRNSFGSLQQCREPQDAVAVLAELVREETRLSLEYGGRVAELSSTIYRNAMDQME